MLEDKIGQCQQHLGRVSDLLAELTSDLGELAGLVAAAAGGKDDEDIQALLRLHHAQLLRLLERSQLAEAAAPPISPAPSAAKFPFRLDPIGREVRIGRRSVSLTRREFQVIELLWEQMPAPVSREALLEHLYGARRARSERVVDVHVHNIRQKLKMAGATDAAIRSRTGEGWTLELHIPAGHDHLTALMSADTRQSAATSSD